MTSKSWIQLFIGVCFFSTLAFSADEALDHYYQGKQELSWIAVQKQAHQTKLGPFEIGHLVDVSGAIFAQSPQIPLAELTELWDFLIKKNPPAAIRISLKKKIEHLKTLKGEPSPENLVAAYSKPDLSAEEASIASLLFQRALIKNPKNSDLMFYLGKADHRSSQSGQDVLKEYIQQENSKENFRKEAFDMILDEMNQEFPKGIPPEEQDRLSALKKKI